MWFRLGRRRHQARDFRRLLSGALEDRCRHRVRLLLLRLLRRDVRVHVLVLARLAFRSEEGMNGTIG